MRICKLLTIAALLTGSLSIMTGCLAVAAAGAAGAGAAYAKGDTEGLVKGDVEAVADATRAVFEEIDIFATRTQVDDGEMEIRGRTAADESVTVTIDPRGRDISKVSVRVGTFGDQQLSGEIFHRLRERVGGVEPAEAEAIEE